MKQPEKHIFINGKIFTSDISCPYADSMVTENGRILWIGQKEKMPPQYAQDAASGSAVSKERVPVTDLGGRRVIPGFVDAHMHPVMLADFRKKITAMPPEINSIEDLVQAVRKKKAAAGTGGMD